MSVKLNIGAGATILEGWIPIDRKIGKEAYPLEYPDNSVDEIRASHILEHFSFRQSIEAIKEWVRVLKPGGKLRIAVPGFDQISQIAQHDPKWSFYLMGGQTDDNDYHKSVWNAPSLESVMKHAGLASIQPWHSEVGDCASLPCSLNLEGVKTESPKLVNVCAVMNLPRVGWNDAWGQTFEALSPLRIPLQRFTGVFWGQCMQRCFNHCVANGVDWILAIDYDSMFTAQHVDQLLGTLGNNPHIDALAAVQARRGQDYPLMTIAKHEKKVAKCGNCGNDYEAIYAEVENTPIQVATAHFGLTLIRVDALKDVAKPWFYAQPDSNCEWEPDGDKLDDDIWFWHQWKKAGKTVYVDPNCRIGHLQLMVSEYSPDMQPRHVYVGDWRKANGFEVTKKEESNDNRQTTDAVEEYASGGGNRDFPQLGGEFDPTRRVRASFREQFDTPIGGSADRNGHVGEPATETAGASA